MKGHDMSGKELRKSARVKSLNLLDYVMLDINGKPVQRGMARTLNVSEVGLLLETHVPLALDQGVIITIELDEDLVELKGRVVHAGPSEEQKFRAGVEFLEIDEPGRRIFHKYIAAFNAAQE